ncbi:hypothetical protein ABH940_006835 [Streptacidiphilus sp. BW17]
MVLARIRPATDHMAAPITPWSGKAREWRRSDIGHRSFTDTAEITVEAWSQAVEGCIGHSMRALLAGWADTSGGDGLHGPRLVIQ